MTRSSNVIGDELEARAERVLGGEQVKQSGGGKFWKLDHRTAFGVLRLVWSCKNTDKPYIRITKGMLREAREAARGMRGSGDGYTAGMIIGVDGEAYVLTRLEDFAEFLTADPSVVAPIAASKAAGRLAGARRHKLG